MKQKIDKFSAKEILTLIVGTTLALTFAIIVGGVMYALVFVTQPIDFQSPNDKAFIDSVLVPIVLFLSGALSGVLAANGLSNTKRGQPVEDDTHA
jgi:O-antigen/teichoic acid export membrane protein